MRDSVKKIVLSGGVVLAVGTWLLIKSLNQVNDFRDKYEGYDLNADVEGTVREGTYTRYQNAHADAPYPDKDVEVPLPDYVSGENVEVYGTYEGVDNALYTGEGSSVTWEVEIPESGLYNVCLEYMTVESRGVAIERALYINGELPFDDAANIAFSRLWQDGGEVRVDNQGNEIRPTQVETYEWQSAYCRDDMGYIAGPYEFYLEKGKNEITLEAVNEPMVIGRLKLAAVKGAPSYEGQDW